MPELQFAEAMTDAEIVEEINGLRAIFVFGALYHTEGITGVEARGYDTRHGEGALLMSVVDSTKLGDAMRLGYRLQHLFNEAVERGMTVPQVPVDWDQYLKL